jgi:hypothetical protein
MNILEDPIQALIAVGKENSELHEELARIYAEVDRYRNALMVIATIPGPAMDVAKRALANRFN